MVMMKRVETYRMNIIPPGELFGEDFVSDTLYKMWPIEKEYGKGPVLYWFPRKRDIEVMRDFSRGVSEGKDEPFLLDAGGGNGFLSYLLAMEGLKVVSLDPNRELVEKAKRTYAHKNLSFEIGTLEDAKDEFKKEGKRPDIIVSSWMPYEVNLTPDIHEIRPRGIVYAKEAGGATGVPGEWELRSLIRTYVDSILKRYNKRDMRELSRHTGLKSKEILSIIKEEGERDSEEIVHELVRKRKIPLSFETGDYESILEIEGPCYHDIRDLLRVLKGKGGYLCTHPQNGNRLEFQKRKDIPYFRISIPENSGSYPWENALKELVSEYSSGGMRGHLMSPEE